MILDNIVADKKAELASVKAAVPLATVKALAAEAGRPRDFESSLVCPGRLCIIAEVKKASPSKGLIRADFDHLSIARLYEQNGASAISVLTEKNYFQGDLSYLREISAAVNIPVLRKDFIFDPYQVYEARANGADTFLLIAAMLETTQMEDLYMLGKELGMEALAEVHDEHELEKVLDCGFYIVGINNRNLHTFEVDLNTTGRLMRDVPYDRVIVSESGVWTQEDIRYLKKAGVDAALIGESLMREADFGKKLKELAVTKLRAEEN